MSLLSISSSFPAGMVHAWLPALSAPHDLYTMAKGTVGSLLLSHHSSNIIYLCQSNVVLSFLFLPEIWIPSKRNGVLGLLGDTEDDFPIKNSQRSHQAVAVSHGL